MVAYSATFSRGETKSIANSSRDYKAAWLIEYRDTQGEHPDKVLIGFARDHGMARAAAAREFASLNSVSRWMRQRHEPVAKRWELLRTEVVDVARS